MRAPSRTLTATHTEVGCDGCGDRTFPILNDRVRAALTLIGWAGNVGTAPNGEPLDLCPTCHTSEVADDGTRRITATPAALTRLRTRGLVAA